jgi:hypothetical protein
MHYVLRLPAGVWVSVRHSLHNSSSIYSVDCLTTSPQPLHSVVCLTTSPQPLPKRVLPRVLSSASSFNFQYPLVFLRLFSSCLRLLPRLLVTSILCSIFPSITCFRRKFLRKVWPIRLDFDFVHTSCGTKTSFYTVITGCYFLGQNGRHVELTRRRL